MDVLSIHVHLRDETYHMINKETLINCRRNLLVINTSRGGVVNEHDIVDLLKQDIFGVILQMF